MLYLPLDWNKVRTCALTIPIQYCTVLPVQWCKKKKSTDGTKTPTSLTSDRTVYIEHPKESITNISKLSNCRIQGQLTKFNCISIC